MIINLSNSFDKIIYDGKRYTFAHRTPQENLKSEQKTKTRLPTA